MQQNPVGGMLDRLLTGMCCQCVCAVQVAGLEERVAQTIRLQEQQAELREQAHKSDMAQQRLQAREREQALELGLAAAKHAAELARAEAGRAVAEALVKVEAPVKSAGLQHSPVSVASQSAPSSRLLFTRA